MKKQKRPFAAGFQAVLIVLLLISMLLVAQQFSSTLYTVGMILLLVSTVIQIGASNINPEADFLRSMKVMGISLLIVAVVFFAGIQLVPFFVSLSGR